MRNLSKGEGMKETEGKKGYGERDTKLGVGSLVEVRLVGKGLSGSWHAAVVVKARPGRRVVEYEELLSDEREGQKLKESIKVGKGVDGVRSSCRKPRQGSPSKDHRIFLRPRPPRISCPSRSSWTRGLCVDVYWKDAWWEGILLQNVRPDKSSVRVFFPDEGGVEECALRDVRIRQEWDEETGSWSLKGHRTTLISSFKHRTSKREDFLEQELSTTVKKLEFLSTEETCREAAFLNDEQDSIPDDDLLESIVKGSRKKLCISKGAGKEFSVIAPKCECQGNDTVVSGGLHRSVQTRYCSKQVSTRRKTRQGEEARSLPPFYDTTVRKKVFKTVDSKNVGGFCQGQECKLSMKPQEAYDDYVDSADHGVGGRRQFLNQNTMDIKGSNASMNHMYRSHQEGSHIERSRYMLVKEEACDDESMDMAVDEKRHSVLHMNGFATSAFPQGCNTPVEAVFSMTPNFLKRQAAGECDFLEPNGDNFGDKFQHFGDKFQHFGKSDKACKKRVSGSHLSGEIERKIERKSKKSRNSVSEDSAGFTGMSYLPKEPFKSKRGWTQYKSPSNQEKLGKKNGTRGGFRMEVLLSAPSGHGLSEDGTGATGGFNARKNILSWLIEAGALVRDQKLFYLHKGKKNLGHGWVTTAGVLCGCCNDIFTLSYFEEHCGSRLHRPCQNIFVDGGKSLTDLQMEVFQKENEFTGSDVHSRMGSGKRRRPEKEKGKVEGDGNDDTCGVCGDGGTLICCDHCPSTFHLTCMEMQEVPKDEWFCPNCRCAICDGSQFNGDQNLFNELTVLFCDQCEREFHVKCLYKRGFPKMDECPQGSWFCGQSCTQIYQSLRGFVGVTNNLSSGFSWTLLRSQAEDSDLKSEGDIELMAEHNIKLSMALSVMQECFKPMIDPRTNIDLVSHVLYNRGSDVSRLNYRGFYTMILEKEDELVSVATIRVHGNVLAEMPLIGTRYQYRRQGMCRRLMYAIEQMLHKIGVKSLVLPAVPELMDTWSGAFGFLPLNSHEKRELTKLNLMAFPGTSLLHKFLPTWPSNSSFRGLLHHVGGTVQVQNISVPQMVNVPIGGPEPFLSGQDMNMSPRAGSLQSYLVKMRDGGSGMFGSDSPASSTSPREVITRRELIHIQHSGAQFDRCRENGYTSKQKSVEKSDRTKVVVGTTRSKRLVKTTQWVADAMNKLAGRPPSQADGVGTKVSMDRSLTLGTSNSPSAVRCMDDQNADEPRKLILRINLSKLKEEKKEKKKKKKDKCQRESSNGEILEAEASHAELDVKPVQSIDFTASRSTNGGAPTFTQDQLQLMSAGGPECTAFVPRVDFRDLEHSPAICGSLTRLVDPDAEFVDIMPALDIGGHLLPLLKHRTRLLRSLPPR